MKERPGNIHLFINEYCQFTPYCWTSINSEEKPVVYKVVTKDLKSLGLRKNTNILIYNINDWTNLPDGEISPGKSDWGGIWSTLRLSGAFTLSRYMMNKYNTSTRIFLSAIDNPLYANTYRVKSQSLILLQEIAFKNEN